MLGLFAACWSGERAVISRGRRTILMRSQLSAEDDPYYLAQRKARPAASEYSEMKDVDNELQHNGEYSIVDASSLIDSNGALAERMTTVVNWAYRGKGDSGDSSNAWTTERHLLSGIRTTAADVDAMLSAAREVGPANRALFVARLAAESENDDEVSRVVGTIQVERSDDGSEAEIGLFSVDPDLQGSGMGSNLLRAAEWHAATVMGAKTAVLWVITSRADLRRWYETRCGYVATERTAPFPTDANVGMPKPGVMIEFVRLEKALETTGVKAGML